MRSRRRFSTRTATFRKAPSSCTRMPDTPASLTAVARHLLHVRETRGPNRGFWVSKLQRECGGRPGDPWCADFVSFVLDVAYMGKPPLAPTGSTKAMLTQATVK